MYVPFSQRLTEGVERNKKEAGQGTRSVSKTFLEFLALLEQVNKYVMSQIESVGKQFYSRLDLKSNVGKQLFSGA